MARDPGPSSRPAEALRAVDENPVPWHPARVESEDGTTVRYERSGPVAVITIDRSERRNAVDAAAASALAEAWMRFDEDGSAAVGVLWGAGGVFSAGADLRAFDLEDRPGGFLGFTRTQVGKPTIAAVEGHCVAGGLEMALWCDLRVAAESAVFGCYERRFGVPLVDGGTQRLPAVVGLGVALDLILTGRSVPAEEAYRIGLVNRLVPEGEALTAAIELGRLIAAFPQATVRSDRAAVLAGLGVPSSVGLQNERRLGLSVLAVAARGAARFAAGEGRGGAMAGDAPVVEDAPPVDAAGPSPAEEAPAHSPELLSPAAEAPATPMRQVVVEVTPDSSAAIRVDTPLGEVSGYLALPRRGRGPGVVLVGEWSDSGAQLRESADRLAAAGFVAFAADVFEGDESVGPESALLLESAIDYVLAHQAAGIGGVGLVGFCKGGDLALRETATNESVRACVSFCGAPAPEDPAPDFASSRAAYLGHCAQEDEWTPPHRGDALEAELRGLGLDATFHAYAGTRHGFFDEGRAAFDPASAELAWERTISFLRRTL